jgi:two-component system chemotaxis sensor kinase CheA
MKEMIDSLKTSAETNSPLEKFDNLPILLERLHSVTSSKERGHQLRKPLRKINNVETPSRIRTSDLDEKIKVKTELLDSLFNVTGELVIAQLMVADEMKKQSTANSALLKKINHQGKLIRELQAISMSLRMVPISGIFQKMDRLVRDLSVKTKKEIKFKTTGGQTELDRNIIDKITDPLIHIIRNCIDHGIETKNERIKAGKNPTATIDLCAFGRSGKIFIEIKDDGKGLNRDKILRKAVDKGIVEAEKKLSNEEISRLIFAPGLSTAQEITSISGRGVGMDIVKKNIEALHGRIDIVSDSNKGTKFTIALPLTLATVDGQIVKIAQNCYMIPVSSIIRSFRPEKPQISKISNSAETVNVEGKFLPIIRLNKILNNTDTNKKPTESIAIIVENAGRQCVLLADDLLDQKQVVIKNLGCVPGKSQVICGGAVMGDGKVMLILDIPGIIKLSHQ